MKSTPTTPAEQEEFDKAVNFDLDEKPVQAEFTLEIQCSNTTHKQDRTH